MKKQFLLLAGTAILLASCGENKTETPAQTQAQIDSAINAKVAEHDAEVARANDSTLKAVEAQKAAAEAEAAAAKANAGGGKKTKVKTTTTKTETTPVVTPTPAPSNPKDNRFNTNPDGSAKPATPGTPNKKDDRFK